MNCLSKPEIQPHVGEGKCVFLSSDNILEVKYGIYSQLLDTDGHLLGVIVFTFLQIFFLISINLHCWSSSQDLDMNVKLKIIFSKLSTR